VEREGHLGGFAITTFCFFGGGIISGLVGPFRPPSLLVAALASKCDERWVITTITGASVLGSDTYYGVGVGSVPGCT